MAPERGKNVAASIVKMPDKLDKPVFSYLAGKRVHVLNMSSLSQTEIARIILRFRSRVFIETDAISGA